MTTIQAFGRLIKSLTMITVLLGASLLVAAPPAAADQVSSQQRCLQSGGMWVWAGYPGVDGVRRYGWLCVMTQRDLDIIASWGVTLPPTSLPLPYSFEGETPHPDHVVALPRPVGEAAGEAFATAKNAIPKGCPVDFKETGFCVY